MLEALAALVMLALMSDQGTASHQTQLMVREALKFDRPRETFYVVFTFDWEVLDEGVVEGLRELHPKYEDMWMDDILRDAPGDSVGRVTVDMVQHMLGSNVRADPADWRFRYRAQIEVLNAWIEQGDDIHVGARFTIDLPDVLQDVLESVSAIPGESDLIGVGAEPRLTDEERGVIEAMLLLDEAPKRDWRDDEMWQLYHRWIWDRLATQDAQDPLPTEPVPI